MKWLGRLVNTRLARGILGKDVFAPVAKIDSCPNVARGFRLPIVKGAFHRRPRHGADANCDG
jgi:hypothetical protein